MALFKHAGTSTELATKEQHDGFVYATVDYIDDEDPSLGDQGVAQWWVDINGKRYRVAAASLIDADGNIFSIEDFVKTSDSIDLEHGGTASTGDATRDVAAAAGARSNLNVYSKTETDDRYCQKTETYTRTAIDTAIDALHTVAYSKSLVAGGWIAPTEEGGYYTCTVAIAGLVCGKDGQVPPSITIDDPDDKETLQTMRDAWQKVDHAIANTETGQIVFYAEEAPETTIDLIITDFH